MNEMNNSNNNETNATTMDAAIRNKIPKSISNADQECISFLMTLKHRAVTPPLSSRPSANANANSTCSRSFPLNAMTEKDTSLPNVQSCSQAQSQFQPRLPVQSHFQANTQARSLPCSSHMPTAMSTMGAMGTYGAMSMPIGTKEDAYFLSDLQCFIRMFCCEFFISDGVNVNTSVHSNMNTTPMLSTTCGSGGGGRGPVSAGRVGIRCSFCKHAPPHTRACQSMSFPSNLSGISGAVGMIQCRHLSQCSMMPIGVRDRLNALKVKGSSKPNNWAGRQQFWVDSAKKLGLYDTHDGIRFASRFASANPPPSATATPNNATSARTISPLFNSPLPVLGPSCNNNVNHYSYPSPTSCANFNASEGSFKVGPSSTLSKTVSSSSNDFSRNLQPQINNHPNSWNESYATMRYDYFDSVEEYHKCHSTSISSQSPNQSYNHTQNLPKQTSDQSISTNQELNADKTKSNEFPKEETQVQTPPQVQSQPTQDNSTANSSSTPTTLATDATKITDERLIELMSDTKLVCTQDKDLVPDYLFLAMSQMEPCRLTDADRVGCYKERDIGFLGMSCKHCGGQPGFGKYFPGTVRSLAQTTTSQTIVKHIAIKCRLCPPEIRLAVVSLQADQANRDKAVKDANKSSFESRPRYGSRKIFFQRLWSRLHGTGKDNANAAIGNSIDACDVNTTEMNGNHEERRAVVSPQLGDTQSYPTEFTNRWPASITHQMMNNKENCNADQTRLNRNDSHNNHNQSHHRSTSMKNEKRSRSVSYLHGENNQYNPRRKMGRVVSSN